MADKSQQQQKGNGENLKLIKSPQAAASFIEQEINENEMSDISEVKKLSIIRDTYKRKTQTLLDEGVKNMLDKKESKLLKVKKLRHLVDTNKALLSQLHNQRTTYDNRIGELAKFCQSFRKKNENYQKEKEAETANLLSTVDSIKKQLEEFKSK